MRSLFILSLPLFSSLQTFNYFYTIGDVIKLKILFISAWILEICIIVVRRTCMFLSTLQQVIASNRSWTSIYLFKMCISIHIFKIPIICLHHIMFASICINKHFYFNLIMFNFFASKLMIHHLSPNIIYLKNYDKNLNIENLLCLISPFTMLFSPFHHKLKTRKFLESW